MKNVFKDFIESQADYYEYCGHDITPHGEINIIYKDGGFDHQLWNCDYEDILQFIYNGGNK